MTLQDLKEDLATCGPMDMSYPSMKVARRVADLFEECPDCGGRQWRKLPDGASVPCHSCDGGIVPTDKLTDLDIGDSEDGIVFAWRRLADYLLEE